MHSVLEVMIVCSLLVMAENHVDAFKLALALARQTFGLVAPFSLASRGIRFVQVRVTGLVFILALALVLLNHRVR